jgi:flagellar hook-associated protein 2
LLPTAFLAVTPCIGAVQVTFRLFLSPCAKQQNTPQNRRYSSDYLLSFSIKLYLLYADKSLNCFVQGTQEGHIMTTSSTISNVGIGSGLDLSTILSELTTAEQAKLTPITDEETAQTTKLTGYSTLKSALQTFNTAVTTMSNANLYNAVTATSSSTSAFTATTTAGASITAGSYSVSVSQLAQAQSLTSAAVTSSSTQLGATTSGNTRTLSITQGSGTPVNITLTDSQTSLTGMVKAINAANAGVTASVVQVSDSQSQLVLTSNTTGTSSAMTLSVSGDDTLNSFLNYSSTGTSNGMTQTVAAQNAKLTVNNVAIERSSNTITNAPQSGITLNLTNTTSGTQTLTVTKSTSDAESAINNFVSAYNTLLTSFSSLTQYTAVSAGSSQSSSNGPLMGDVTTRNMKNAITSVLSTQQTGSSLGVIGALGITMDTTTGQLTVDSTKLESALSNSTSAVSALIVGDGKTTGVGTLLTNLDSTYLSSTGTIATAENAINTNLNKLADKYTEQNTLINSTIANYKTQFSNLSTLMSSLNSTSTYLTEQFSSTSSSTSSVTLGQ